MTDACPRLDDALGIASLFRLMVAHAIDQPKPGSAYSQKSRWIVMENRWRAKRYGSCAAFLIEGHDQQVNLEQWLCMAEQVMGKTARTLGVENIFEQLQGIVRDGTSADRQRHVYEQAIAGGAGPDEALCKVADHLIMETQQHPFLP